MSKLKGSKLLDLSALSGAPKGTRLPTCDPDRAPEVFSFSFAYFDREHELFNLGNDRSDRIVESRWFLDLLDVLKDVSNTPIPSLRGGKFDLHPVSWESFNTSAPNDFSQQYEYKQFRLNKSKGRIIGFVIDGVFYIVWLDPHHNGTDSPHYGRAEYYPRPRSQYELMQDHITNLLEENERLKEENRAFEELFAEPQPH